MTSTTASLTQEEASLESCMTPSGTSPREARRLTPLLMMKGRTRIGTGMYPPCEEGKAAQVASEMWQYNISGLAICKKQMEYSRSAYTCNWRVVTLLWARGTACTCGTWLAKDCLKVRKGLPKVCWGSNKHTTIK